jgi:hypothetical protein
VNNVIAICLAVCAFVVATHFLNIGKLDAWQWLLGLAGALGFAVLISERGQAFQEVVIGRCVTVKMREVEQMRADVFAKAELVRETAEAAADLIAFNTRTANRFAGEGWDHSRQILAARDKIVAMLKATGSSDQRIATVVDPMNRTVENDILHELIARIRNAAVAKSRAAGVPSEKETAIVDETAKQFQQVIADYDRSKASAWLEAKGVMNAEVGEALDVFDRFRRTKHVDAAVVAAPPPS